MSYRSPEGPALPLEERYEHDDGRVGEISARIATLKQEARDQAADAAGKLGLVFPLIFGGTVTFQETLETIERRSSPEQQVALYVLTGLAWIAGALTMRAGIRDLRAVDQAQGEADALTSALAHHLLAAIEPEQAEQHAMGTPEESD